MNWKKIDKWHKTRKGLIVFGLVELVIAYLFASWAIDSGSLWLYLFTFIFSFGTIQNFSKLIGSKNGEVKK